MRNLCYEKRWSGMRDVRFLLDTTSYSTLFQDQLFMLKTSKTAILNLITSFENLSCVPQPNYNFVLISFWNLFRERKDEKVGVEKPSHDTNQIYITSNSKCLSKTNERLKHKSKRRTCFREFEILFLVKIDKFAFC